MFLNVSRIFIHYTIIIIGMFVIPFSPVRSSHTFWRELATFLTLVLRESLAIFLLLCKSLKVIDISVKKQITLIYLFNIIAMNACICMYVYLYVPWMIKWSTTQATWILQDTMYDGTYRLFSSQLEKIRVHFFLSFCLFLSLFIAIIV